MEYSVFAHDREERKTYWEVVSTKDVPWEVEMGKGGGGQRVGTEWLRKVIHPCNMEKIQLNFHSRKQKKLWERL